MTELVPTFCSRYTRSSVNTSKGKVQARSSSPLQHDVRCCKEIALFIGNHIPEKLSSRELEWYWKDEEKMLHSQLQDNINFRYQSSDQSGAVRGLPQDNFKNLRQTLSTTNQLWCVRCGGMIPMHSSTTTIRKPCPVSESKFNRDKRTSIKFIKQSTENEKSSRTNCRLQKNFTSNLADQSLSFQNQCESISEEIFSSQGTKDSKKFVENKWHNCSNMCKRESENFQCQKHGYKNIYQREFMKINKLANGFISSESSERSTTSGKKAKFNKSLVSSTNIKGSQTLPTTTSKRLLKNRQNLRTKSLFKSDLQNRNKKENLKTIQLFNLSRLLMTWIIALLVGFLNAGRILTGTIISHKNSKGLVSRRAVFVLWTLIVLPGDSKRVLGNSLLVTPSQFCTRTRFLNARQQEICRNHSHILKYVEEGIIQGSHRCQREFQYNKWNCSRSPKTYYSRLLNQDIRETAYVNAMMSAAVTYAVTYACSKGEIPDCGCEENSITSYELLKQEAIKRNYKTTEENLRKVAAEFEWGGCGDQIEYGDRISRLFTENFGRKFQSSDLKAKIEIHNMEAGRLAITNHMRRDCRCHGITGTCALQTCWDRMPKWQDVGNRLRNHFDGAVRVQLANDGRSLLSKRKQRIALKQYPYPRRPYPDATLNRYKRNSPEIYTTRTSTGAANIERRETERRRRRRKFKTKGLRRRRGGDRGSALEDENLVYSQESPDFCKRNRKNGSLGTIGRRCIPNSTGAGSCEYLCCGRTYQEHVITVTKDCNCRFEYCCKLVCDKCTSQETVHTCV
uniref:uncharacterized protein LOC120329347 n=1 Tax=Styela clava TaxID=7725 RepID=UPI00193A46F5|nr:uncharacterized protein LOC120329347 [Styela clava]